MSNLLLLLASCVLPVAIFISTVLLVEYRYRRAQKEADEMNEEFRKLSEKTGRVYPKIYVE